MSHAGHSDLQLGVKLGEKAVGEGVEAPARAQ